MASISSKYCCMNTRPTPSTSSNNSPRRSTQVSFCSSKKEGSWRRQCAVGMACLIISIENAQYSMTMVVNAESVAANAELVVESKKNIATQWSDRRCEPWLKHSLETIVPENLPRPSAHRRWEQVRYSKHNVPVAVKMVGANKCFTM